MSGHKPFDHLRENMTSEQRANAAKKIAALREIEIPSEIKKPRSS